jgi:transposase-like protein
MAKPVVKRYAEGFKRQVVREYEAGQSVYALQQKYGIGAHVTIKRWVEKYGSAGYRTERVVIQSVEDQQEYKAMKARVRELEAALAESVLNVRMLEAVLEAASEGLHMDLKKTFGKQP